MYKVEPVTVDGVIVKYQVIVEISLAEKKAAEVDMIDIGEWVQNAISNKSRQMIDQIVTDNSDKQPQKISVFEKENLVLTVDVKSAATRQAEFEAKMGK